MNEQMTASQMGKKGGASGRGKAKNRTPQLLRYWADVRAGRIKRLPRKVKQLRLPLMKGNTA
jgi:hypothetical protein